MTDAALTPAARGQRPRGPTTVPRRHGPFRLPCTGRRTQRWRFSTAACCSTARRSRRSPPPPSRPERLKRKNHPAKSPMIPLEKSCSRIRNRSKSPPGRQRLQGPAEPPNSMIFLYKPTPGPCSLDFHCLRSWPTTFGPSFGQPPPSSVAAIPAPPCLLALILAAHPHGSEPAVRPSAPVHWA